MALLRLSLVILCLGLAAACSSSEAARQRPAIERVAIAPLDNQSSDVSDPRIGARVAALTSLALTGTSDAFFYTVSSGADAPLRRASQLVTGYLAKEPLDGAQRWTLHAQVRDMASPRALRDIQVSGTGVAELADALAAQLGKPGFQAAGKDLTVIEAALAGKAPADSVTALGLGAAAQSLLMPMSSNDSAARVKAVERRSQLAPADSELAAASAMALLQRRQFDASAQAFRRAQRADPEWADVYNQSGFAEAFAGDAKAALAAIATYQKLDNTANPLDSLGEVNTILGRFDDAERAFLATNDKDPSFIGGVALRKAAVVRRLAGNQAEADKLFERYAAAQAKNPHIDLERAQWNYTSGRGKEALTAAESLAARTNSSFVWTQVSAWRAAQQSGDAQAAAREALKSAKTGPEQQSAIVALFATQPDVSATEWQARAAKQFPGPATGLGRYALLHALILRKHWAEAIPLLAEYRESMHPAQASHWQSLLAIALHESGQADRAKAETKTWPLPRTIGEGTWDFLVYPKIAAITKRGS